MGEADKFKKNHYKGELERWKNLSGILPWCLTIELFSIRIRL